MIPKIQKLINNTKAIFKVDSEPTKGSNNLVTSGGVYKTFKSNCGSSAIVLNLDWESETFPTKLENVTNSVLPELQHYFGNPTEYISQLPLLYVAIPKVDFSVDVYLCVLKSAVLEVGDDFVWEPIEEAPFTKIEARYGVGSTSWVWTIFTE